jgi:hypothetical protein
MPIHVFFDNSNVLGGAQATFAEREPHIPWYLQRVHFGHIFDLIENGRKVGCKVLGGSVPPSSESLWDYARKKGYNTDLLRRVEKDDGKFGEQAVDEVLHLKIANALLDFDPPQHLVVASGDGRLSLYGTGFATQIERALRAGWTAEVWSWNAALHKKYWELERKQPEVFRVNLFDPYFDQITFVKAGVMFPSPGVRVEIAGRVVAKLRIPEGVK